MGPTHLGSLLLEGLTGHSVLLLLCQGSRAADGGQGAAPEHTRVLLRGLLQHRAQALHGEVDLLLCLQG